MSLREIRFYVDFFPDSDGAVSEPAARARSEKQVLVLLEALCLLNQFYLADHPETPLLYDLYREGKIKYKLPNQLDGDHGQFMGETFRDIPRIIENGGGDCDNIASWRVAELRHLGIAAQPYITNRPRPGGGTIYHVIVQWPDGSSEDPCLLIGMAPERTAEIEAEKRKRAERVIEAATGTLQSRSRPESVLGHAAMQRNGLLEVMGWFLKGRDG